MARKLPMAGCLLSLLVFGGSVLASAHLLPGRVASHFDLSGRADGWMERADYLAFILGAGAAVPLLLMGVGWSIRFFPPGNLNVPNAAYWRSPEHYPKACAFLFSSLCSLAAEAALLFTMLNGLVVAHNWRGVSIGGAVETLGALFLVGVGVWIADLYRFFNRAGGNASDRTRVGP